MYKPIESYGVIGDLCSVALVAKDGSIDWCCLPRFDSPSVFGAILDAEKGGYFSIRATHKGTCRQMYLPDTNVLVTRFLSADGVGEVTDFMPISSGRIVRIARAVRGSIPFRMEMFPAYDYARASHTITMRDGGAVIESGEQRFYFEAPVPLRREGPGLTAEFMLAAGETATFIFGVKEDRGDCLEETVRFWRSWIQHCKYRGRWREMVNRSALVLKLLTYEPTGAVVAAATTSLPEEIGGVRNWDYRFTWVRDAAFTVYALMRLGYTEEAAAFTNFIQARAREPETVNGPLNVLYAIDGRHSMHEECLDHLDGYRGSKPVRIGNGAAGHLQLDIYGELMDSIYLYDKYGSPLSYDMWSEVERLLDWVSDNWEQPDQSIWEVRGGKQQFTYSKLQCWVALDRGLRLGMKRSFPMNGHKWLGERDRIYRWIMESGWNPELRSFVQYEGADAVDASALMMPLMLFVSPTDPRMIATIDQIERDLVADSLVYRYDIGKAARDGLPGDEGTFSICTFWLVEALARGGRLHEAQFVFEKMLTYANHLGLYAEEIGPMGEALGNFPQAFTHLGLISAAFSLDRHLGGS